MRKGNEIKKVLLTVPYGGRHLEKLEKALAPAQIARTGHYDDPEGVAAALKEADVAILGGDLDDRYLSAPCLKWVHCDHAGLNNSARPGVFEKGLIVTGSAGRSGPVLAEHILFFALSLIYNSPRLHEAKKLCLWDSVNGYRDRRGMFGKTMGIIGLGYTGKELAKRARLFGMRVLGFRRTVTEPPEGVDTLYCFDRGETVDELLAASDIVVLCVRLSDETHHLIGTRELGIMKNSAFLINMARGPVVDEAALVKALHEGTIAGAGADTFDQEPLPKDSPLWDAPNLIITPHCTPEMPDLTAQSLEIICENIRRYRAGEEMRNMLTPRDVYHHYR